MSSLLINKIILSISHILSIRLIIKAQLHLHSSARNHLQRIANHKEDVMRGKSMLVVACVAVMAVTGVVSVSESFAAVSRVDVIGDLRETVAQSDSMKAQGERVRVDVIESVGSEGTVYPYIKPISR
jgi:hypothetical protein